ncbi:MAG: hypothetical protein IKZ28_00045 [Clostridia bacterium]|nr:hypothetical protein [Clostridia bacterium]
MGKKLIAWVIALGMCFSFASCSDLLDMVNGALNGSSSSLNSDLNSSPEESSKGETTDSGDSSNSGNNNDSGNSGNNNDSGNSNENENPNDSGDNENEGGNEGGNEGETAEYVTVTFKQAGQNDIVKTVEKDTALTDIPTPVAKKGYTVYWDVTDFTKVEGDMIVNAVEEVKTYTVICNPQEDSLSQTTFRITYGEEYELPALTHEDKTFEGWSYNGVLILSEGVWEIDNESGEVVLMAEWVSDWTGNY